MTDRILGFSAASAPKGFGYTNVNIDTSVPISRRELLRTETEDHLESNLGRLEWADDEDISEDLEDGDEEEIPQENKTIFSPTGLPNGVVDVTREYVGRLGPDQPARSACGGLLMEIDEEEKEHQEKGQAQEDKTEDMEREPAQEDKTEDVEEKPHDDGQRSVLKSIGEDEEEGQIYDTPQKQKGPAGRTVVE